MLFGSPVCRRIHVWFVKRDPAGKGRIHKHNYPGKYLIAKNVNRYRNIINVADQTKQT